LAFIENNNGLGLGLGLGFFSFGLNGIIDNQSTLVGVHLNYVLWCSSKGELGILGQKGAGIEHLGFKSVLVVAI